MAEHSDIEWTDATWNVITGCSVLSPGCTNCYAMRLAGTRLRNHPSRAGLTKESKAGPIWTGDVRFNEAWLTQPLTWVKPRRIFVCAHADLFHENVPDEWIDKVFAVMALTPHHTYQVLTKRSDRMREYLSTADRCERVGDEMMTLASLPAGTKRVEWPLLNVWLGISCERQQELEERAPHLQRTPAAIRYISAEPLLGPIDTTDCCNGHYFFDVLRGTRWHDNPDGPNAPEKFLPGIDWVIVGGENGDRPMHPGWARGLRDQCADAGVPFFFKQWGEYLPVGQTLPGYGKIHGATAVKPGRMKLHYGGTPQQPPMHVFAEFGVKFASTDDGRLTFRVGKAAAGRLLDGVEHNGMPEVR